MESREVMGGCAGSGNRSDSFMLVCVNGTWRADCDWCGTSTEADPSYAVYQLALAGVVMPIVGVFGVLANLVSAFIYSRPSMLSSTNVYLCSLAVSDCLVVSSGLYLFTLECLRHHNDWLATWYPIPVPYIFPLSLISQTCSVYLTVAAGVDCFMLLIPPLSWRDVVCKVKVANYTVLMVVLFAVNYNMPHWFELYVTNCWNTHQNHLVFELCPTLFRVNEVYIKYYYTYAYAAVMTAGPLFVLIVLNTAIIVASLGKRWKANKRKRGGTDMKCMQPKIDDDPPTSEGDIVTLVLVVCLFIACNTLALIINVLETSVDSVLLSYLVDVSNLMVIFNSSANFVIYYAFGESFRKTLHWYCLVREIEEHNKPKVLMEPAQNIGNNNNININSNNTKEHLDLMRESRCKLYESGGSGNGECTLSLFSADESTIYV